MASLPSCSASCFLVRGRSSLPISEKSTPDAAVGDEVPAGDLVVGACCAHADSHGHRLGIFEGAAAELHPHVGVRAVLAPVEQVGLHRALFTGERC